MDWTLVAAAATLSTGSNCIVYDLKTAALRLSGVTDDVILIEEALH